MLAAAGNLLVWTNNSTHVAWHFEPPESPKTRRLEPSDLRWQNTLDGYILPLEDRSVCDENTGGSGIRGPMMSCPCYVRGVYIFEIASHD